MMRAVVTSGTGTAAAGVAGGPVYAKTGTAEFGSGTALKNHAWFVGWQGTTAFAVFVDVGASGGADRCADRGPLPARPRALAPAASGAAAVRTGLVPDPHPVDREPRRERVVASGLPGQRPPTATLSSR